jgi:hypothetical protein
MLIEIAALLLGGTSLQSGSADLDCILNRVPRAEQARIGASVQSTQGNGPPSQILQRANDTCAQQGGWDADYSRGMTILSLSAILGSHAAADLGRVGISTELIDHWLDRQSDQIRTDINAASAAATNLVEELAAAGVPMAALEEHGHTIGVYLGSLVMIERTGRGLPPQ